MSGPALGARPGGCPRTHLAPWLAVLLGAQACTGSRGGEAPDSVALAEALARDPAGTAATIESMADGPSRALALDRLVFADLVSDGDLRRLCEALTTPALRERCERYLSRPHLFTRGPTAPSVAEPAMPGPPPGSCRVPCPASGSEAQCFADRAVALRGGREEPARACSCPSQALARQECFFLYAEAILREQAESRFLEAAEACASSGRLAGDCLNHIQGTLAGATPPLAVDEAPERWRERVDTLQRLDALLRQRGLSAQAPMLIDSIWAASLAYALQTPRAIQPEIVGLLPPEAVPHLRAALAWHVAAATRGEGGDLGSLGRALAEAERGGAIPVTTPPVPATPIPVEAAPEITILSEAPVGADVGRDGSWSQVRHSPFLLLGPRAVSQDPEVDRILCLLEASVRLYPRASGPLIEAARARPEVEVQETVAHLERWLQRIANRSATPAPPPRP